MNVVDVARALDMSHANVYRHFSSKAELLDAIAEKWLHTVSDPLEKIVVEPLPASVRLEHWILALFRAKKGKVTHDPELFAMYHQVAEGAHEVVSRHVNLLLSHLERIIRDGIASGEFPIRDATAAAHAVLNSTVRFHHPAMIGAADGSPGESEARAVVGLLIAGLRAGAI